MLDLKILNKVDEVEKQTGQSLLNLLSQVPFGNVLTAGSVPFQTLVHGLRIITPDEISQISPSKLKIVLKYGNMHTVEALQSKFGSRSIIIVVNKLSETELKTLLEEDNLDVISAIIEGMEFANYS